MGRPLLPVPLPCVVLPSVLVVLLGRSSRGPVHLLGTLRLGLETALSANFWLWCEVVAQVVRLSQRVSSCTSAIYCKDNLLRLSIQWLESLDPLTVVSVPAHRLDGASAGCGRESSLLGCCGQCRPHAPYRVASAVLPAFLVYPTLKCA